MTRATIPDPVPLGVAGSATIPRDQYRASAAGKSRTGILLLTEEERITYIARRLTEALDRPLTSPGSAGFVHRLLERFEGLDVMLHFAEKAMETLRDHQCHNRVLFPPDRSVAISFLAWSGTHREVQPQRFGNYLSSLYTTACQILERGIKIQGFLELDAYLRDNPNSSDPMRPLSEVFEIDVEYSYLPGFAFGSKEEKPSSLLNVIMLNPDLCTPEENQLLRKLTARQR